MRRQKIESNVQASPNLRTSGNASKDSPGYEIPNSFVIVVQEPTP